MSSGKKGGSPQTLRIIGVDPGTLVTGYGVIDLEGKKMRSVEHGIIKTGAKVSMPLRLRTIHCGLMEVLERTAPDEFAIESAFYSKNVQSTLKLGHARGVAILAAALREIPTSEYAPREVKQSVVGNGNASKDQVAFMVRSSLGIDPDETISLDASDALGVALCHIVRRDAPAGATKTTTRRKGRKGWAEFLEKNPERVKG